MSKNYIITIPKGTTYTQGNSGYPTDLNGGDRPWTVNNFDDVLIGPEDRPSNSISVNLGANSSSNVFEVNDYGITIPGTETITEINFTASITGTYLGGPIAHIGLWSNDPVNGWVWNGTMGRVLEPAFAVPGGPFSQPLTFRMTRTTGDNWARTNMTGVPDDTVSQVIDHRSVNQTGGYNLYLLVQVDSILSDTVKISSPTLTFTTDGVLGTTPKLITD